MTPGSYCRRQRQLRQVCCGMMHVAGLPNSHPLLLRVCAGHMFDDVYACCSTQAICLPVPSPAVPRMNPGG